VQARRRHDGDAGRGQRLTRALAQSPLPAEPDRSKVDHFLVDAHRRAWGW